MKKSRALQLIERHTDLAAGNLYEFHKPLDDMLESWHGLSCFVELERKWIWDARDLKRILTLDALRMFQEAENHASLANNAFNTMIAVATFISMDDLTSKLFFDADGFYTEEFARDFEMRLTTWESLIKAVPEV